MINRRPLPRTPTRRSRHRSTAVAEIRLCRQLGLGSLSHVSDPDTTRHANVWIFHGTGSHFASGVFTDRQQGLAWIARHRLTGILTEYPVGDGCYDIAVRDTHFTPSKPHHGTPAHVAGFSPGHTDHIHVRDGAPDNNYDD